MGPLHTIGYHVTESWFFCVRGYLHASETYLEQLEPTIDDTAEDDNNTPAVDGDVV